jgi:hypothetical protein
MSRRSKKSAFRSTFEEDVSKILKGFDYEPFTVPYVIERNYRPDFVHNASGTLVDQRQLAYRTTTSVCAYAAQQKNKKRCQDDNVTVVRQRGNTMVHVEHVAGVN